MKDWADRLAERYALRGQNEITAESLRTQVEFQCKQNIKRGKWKSKDERANAYKEEMKRLVKLRKDENKREQLVYDFAQKGFEVEADYNQIGKIESVKLPLSPEEWADVLNKEGEHLQMCCADISAIRNILQTACREDGYIQAEELFEAAHLAIHHGWELKADPVALDAQIKKDPIARIIHLWNTLEKDLRTGRSHTASGNLDKPQDALEALYRAAGTIAWNELFTKTDTDPDRVFSNHKDHNYALATIQTTVRTLFFKLKELYQGDIEGYGLIRQDGEIGVSRTGIAVYRTKKLAQDICDNWNEGGGTRSKKDTYTVKKVRVSMEKGVEVME